VRYQFAVFVFVVGLVRLLASPEVFDRLTYHTPPKELSPEAVTEDWPRFLGPRHDLHSRETKLSKAFPETGPNKVWEMERGSGHAPVVVVGDYLVAIHELDGLETIECLQPGTGKRYWKYDYPVQLGSNYGIRDAPRAGPVIDGDLVFTVGVKGDLLCLELDSGEVVWKKNLDDAYGHAPLFFGRGSCPLVYEDQLIVNVGGDICVASFNKRTGELLWKTEHDWHASYASPVPAEINGQKRVMVLTGGMVRPPVGGLLRIDPKNGSIEASIPWRAQMFASVNAASPVVVGNCVFITEAYTEGGALIEFAEDGSGSTRWKAERFGSQFTTPVAHEGYLYGVHGTGGTEVVCYDIESGKEIWRDSIEIENARLGRASLLHIDGAFLCVGAQGTLIWLDLSPEGANILSQTQLFRAPETWGVPTVSKGLLYVNQNAIGSRLICYDLRDE
tara:strand:+ start:353 stop:1690 length:1338 start_codon:yes stop_codon:yes gene_type:complete